MVGVMTLSLERTLPITSLPAHYVSWRDYALTLQIELIQHKAVLITSEAYEAIGITAIQGFCANSRLRVIK